VASTSFVTCVKKRSSNRSELDCICEVNNYSNCQMHSNGFQCIPRAPNQFQCIPCPPQSLFVLSGWSDELIHYLRQHVAGRREHAGPQAQAGRSRAVHRLPTRTDELVPRAGIHFHKKKNRHTNNSMYNKTNYTNANQYNNIITPKLQHTRNTQTKIPTHTNHTAATTKNKRTIT
jgi:hypothetical protein